MTEPIGVALNAPTPPLSAAPSDQNSTSGFRALWETWTHRIFTMREDQFFLFLAVLIGILSGLAVVCFRIAIEWTQIELLGSSLAPSTCLLYTSPATE